MGVGAAMREIRQAKRLTQQAVGRRAGLATSYLSRIENGHIQPTAATIDRIAGALGVPVGDIFARPGQEPDPGHRCPVSTSGECIGRLIRDERRAVARPKLGYSEEELRLLRMTDYLVLHGSPEVRAVLAHVLDALMRNSAHRKKGRRPRSARRKR